MVRAIPAGLQSGSLPSNSWRPAHTARFGCETKYDSMYSSTKASQTIGATGAPLDAAAARVGCWQPVARIRNATARIALNGSPVSRLEFIGRQGGKARVVHRPTHREVIQTLPEMIADAEQRVHLVVEIAADSRGAYARRLGLEIERVPEHAALPEKMAVAPRRAPG